LEGDVIIPSGCEVSYGPFQNCKKIHNFIFNGSYTRYERDRAEGVMTNNTGDGTGLFYCDTDFNMSSTNNGGA
jgi:hypothetical protein